MAGLDQPASDPEIAGIGLQFRIDEFSSVNLRE